MVNMTDGAALASLSEARHVIARTSTTAERVADAIREEAAEGRLPPGSRLPEQAICTVLGVSRNTVREAMSQLVAERVLTREPNRGVFVAVPDSHALQDVYRARRLIEPAAVRYGEAFDDASVAAVRAAVTEGQAALAAGHWEEVGSANGHFHRAIVALSGSPRLEQQMALLLAEMRLVFHRMSEVRDFHGPYVARNDEITALLEQGDRDGAADSLVAYLGVAEAQLLDAYATL